MAQPGKTVAEYENDVDAIPINRSVVESYRVSRVFQDNTQPVSYLDFDHTGQVCITSSEDDSLHLYDCRYGQCQKTLYSKKYGVALAQFTHHASNIVYASAKGNDHALRYLSCHDNRYLMYFSGHEQRVRSLHMSPIEDTFLSASQDQTIRLWDLRSPHCQALLHNPLAASALSVAFDPCGVVFATLVEKVAAVLLYDLKNLDAGPFSKFLLADALRALRPAETTLPTLTGLKFSPDGKRILLCSTSDSHFVIDAYSGQLNFRLTGHTPLLESNGGEISFSPDGQFVTAGSQDGALSLWQLPTETPPGCVDLQPFTGLEGHHTPSRVVSFNPCYSMLVTGGDDL
ncbi:hypothetical protein H4R33_007165, partial [Dimargaris cristalligena]